MSDRLKAITFDVDSVSLVSLEQAFPEWEIESINGATSSSVAREWNPRAADLLVVGVLDAAVETLGLCRGLRSQAGRRHTPLFALLAPGQESWARAALDAGANSCLVLPVHPKELVNKMARAWAGNRPGRHTLGSDRAQREDRWRDHGGEA